MPPKLLACLVILCFERRCPKQNIVARLKSKDLHPPKNFGLTTPLRRKDFFRGNGATVVKFHFTDPETKKYFSAKKLIAKYQISKSREALDSPCAYFRHPREHNGA